MIVRFKKLRPEAVMPTYAHDGDAGADLYVSDAKMISPHGRAMFDTGIAVELPPGYFGDVRARSSTTKSGLAVIGVIDAPYRGGIRLCVWNITEEWQSVSAGYRLAQLIIIKCERAEFIEADELSDSSRGAGGYGSSGR